MWNSINRLRQVCRGASVLAQVRPGLAIATAVLGLAVAEPVAAQRPPQRGLGQPLQVQPGPSQSSGGNATLGAARFVRGNRSRRDFVGTSRSDLAGFVGSQQSLGVGRVAPSVSGGGTATADAAVGARGTASNARAGARNPRIPPLAKNAMYYPRLELDAEVVSQVAVELEATAARQLSERLSELAGSEVIARVEGRTAILTGSVSSKSEADRLAVIAGFQPGVDQVRTELTVSKPD